MHCNTLQHAATRCNTLQHAATRCNTLQHAATHCNTQCHATNEMILVLKRQIGALRDEHTKAQVKMCCSVLHSVALYCSMLQCVAAHLETSVPRRR